MSWGESSEFAKSTRFDQLREWWKYGWDRTGVWLDPRREPQPLISEGLESPVGLAMDHARHGLYVADPQALKIYRYIASLDLPPS